MKTTPLRLFEYNGGENRVCAIDGQPWFVAADFIPHFTGYSVSACLKKHVPDGCKQKAFIPTASGERFMWLLDYHGLKALETAFPQYGQSVMAWVHAYVLPVLRYDPKQQQTIDRQAAEIKALKSDYALLTLDFNMILDSAGKARRMLHGISEAWEPRSMTLDELISLLHGLGVDTSKDEFCDMLCEAGYLMDAPEALRNLPTAKGVESGLFSLCVRGDENGETLYQTKITPEGMAFIVAYFSDESA